ncbi:type II secretion system F family protein, partial [bacterium]|nr:type II secretion system F family protein [bacterium]
MTVFTYKATDINGKLTTGTMEAKDESMVITRLREKNFYPIKIDEADAKKKISKDISVKHLIERIKFQDVLSFTQQLSSLMEAQVPLDRSLAICIELIENKKFKAVIENVRRSVQGGSSFAEALSKHPNVFNKLFINMVRAGESGGVLESVISRLNIFMESRKEMRDYVVSAMIYPLLLTIVGGAAVTVLLIYVVPKFAQIFSDMGQALPLPTQVLMSVSEFLAKYFWLLGLVIAGLIILYRQLMKKEANRYTMDKFKLKLPIFGSLIEKIEVGRFASTLGTMIKSGVPIINALMIVRDTVSNSVIAKALLNIEGEQNGKNGSAAKGGDQKKETDIISSVRKGKGVAEPLKKSCVFPPLAIHMVTIGEETGQLEDMLFKVASIYEVDVRNSIKRAISLLEPLMIFLMGLIVGFIV